MAYEPMDEGVSGFKVRGSWADIVEHGRRITDALRELLVRDEDNPFRIAFQEWEDWRPKRGDTLEGEMARKTSDQASIEEGEGEQKGKGPGEDIRSAGEQLKEATPLGEDPDDGSVGDSGRYVLRAADSTARKLFRTLEELVYEKVMTKVSPYYFDNDLVSANLQRDRRPTEDEDSFIFEVNINDDDLKDRVSDRLDEKTDRPQDPDEADEVRSRTD